MVKVIHTNRTPQWRQRYGTWDVIFDVLVQTYNNAFSDEEISKIFPLFFVCIVTLILCIFFKVLK